MFHEVDIMRYIGYALLALAVVIPSAVCMSGQSHSAVETDPIFIRVTIYPTASLSRYDYNNDIDLYEIRPYIEVRAGSANGIVISDARVTVSGTELEFKDGQYLARIPVKRDALPKDFSIRIAAPERRIIEKTLPLLGWLILESPRPDIIESGQDIEVRWMSTGTCGPVNVRAYDFKSDRFQFNLDDVENEIAVIPADFFPPSTIVRLFVITSWISKRFFEDPGTARGSEINVIPWSQVFFRTK